MPVQAPRAIIIDMDDTILAAGRRPEVLLHVAHDLRADLAGHAPEVIAERLELAFAAFWSDPVRHREARFGVTKARRGVVRESFAELPGLSAELAEAFADRFSAMREAIAGPFPGAIAGLEALRASGLPMGMITNGDGPGQRAKIERFDLARWFDHIQIEGELGVGKPAPEAYAHAARSLGADVEATWIVGDDLEWEVRAPQRLGMTTIWCDGYAQGLPAEAACTPDHIVTRLDELPPLVRAAFQSG